MNLPLAPGTYSFVVWGGITGDDYSLNCGNGDSDTRLVAGVSHIDDVRVRLAGNHSRERTTAPPDKFHGEALDREITGDTQNVVTVNLTKNTNEIRLTILGLPTPPAEETTRANPYPQINLWMTAANAGYDFHNTLDCSSPPITYHALNTDGDPAGTMTASLHTLRLQLKDPAGNNISYRYTLWNSETATTFHSADLLHDIITKTTGGHYNTQAEIDAEDLFRITIDLAAHAGVSVTVNDYKVNATEHIIQ
jgi:hypothetical protein